MFFPYLAGTRALRMLHQCGHSHIHWDVVRGTFTRPEVSVLGPGLSFQLGTWFAKRVCPCPCIDDLGCSANVIKLSLHGSGSFTKFIKSVQTIQPHPGSAEAHVLPVPPAPWVERKAECCGAELCSPVVILLQPLDHTLLLHVAQQLPVLLLGAIADVDLVGPA